MSNANIEFLADLGRLEPDHHENAVTWAAAHLIAVTRAASPDDIEDLFADLDKFDKADAAVILEAIVVRGDGPNRTIADRMLAERGEEEMLKRRMVPARLQGVERQRLTVIGPRPSPAG